MSSKSYSNKFITLLIFSILFLISCASTPDSIDSVTVDNTMSDEIIDDKLALTTLEELKEYRKEAIEVKAPNAATTVFNRAEDLYSKGLEKHKNGDFNSAVELYRNATDIYKESITESNMQRELALAAIQNAELAIMETELNAEKAKKEGMEEENEK